MPTATPFTALGRGNGFPACVPRLDIDDYAYWTTLGGFNKNSGGTPTEFQIAKSEENAMKLFWNLYGFTGRAQAVSFAFPEETIVTNLTVEDEDDPDLDQTFDIVPSNIKQPYQRVCLKDKDKNEIIRLGYAKAYEPVPGGRLVLLFASNFFYRLYVNDEYVGMGFFVLSAFVRYTGFGSSESVVRLGSMVFSEEVDYGVAEYAYVTVNGIPFVSTAFAYDHSNDGSENVDAENLSASTNVTNATITGLEFYTYP